MRALRSGASHFTSCCFESGQADAEGGALQVAGSASFHVAGVEFRNNSAGGHGAAINFDPTSVESKANIGSAAFHENRGLSTVRAAQFADWDW